VDSGGAQLCGLVATGVLTCETDFCPDCTNAHKCDSTCDFDCAPAAGGGGGGKHGGGGGKHRRAQGIQLNHVCSALNIDEKVRKRVSLRHFILKMILLPRQARDEHSESTQNETCFLTGCPCERRML
jgi:hypothetical protein